jgi:hypothetical protein
MLDAAEAVPTGPHKMRVKKWRIPESALQASQRASPRLAAQDSRPLAPVPELSASPPVVEGNLSYAYGAASAPVVMEKPSEVSSTQSQDAPTTVMSPGKRAAEGSPVGTAEHTPKKARKDSDEEPIGMRLAFTHAQIAHEPLQRLLRRPRCLALIHSSLGRKPSSLKSLPLQPLVGTTPSLWKSQWLPRKASQTRRTTRRHPTLS